MNIFSRIYQFFNKITEKIRSKLIHHPIIYAFIGGVGVIIFWRGVWHTADYVMKSVTVVDTISSTSSGELPWWDGPLSIFVGSLILLMVGLFISSFIGTEIAISGLRGEKRVTEKTEKEVELEVEESSEIKQEIHEIDSRIKHMEEMLARGENKK